MPLSPKNRVLFAARSTTLPRALVALIAGLSAACAVGTAGDPPLADQGRAESSDEALGWGGPTCKARGDVGDRCATGDTCVAGAYCDDTTKTCAALPGDGAPCGNGAQCAPGLGCDVSTSRCGPLPTEGKPCALGLYGPFLCADGLGCGDGGTCVPLPGEGQPCAGNNLCAAPLACDFTADGSFCRARRAAGGPCQNDSICAEGTFCDFGTLACTPYLRRGAVCRNGNECGPSSACNPPLLWGSYRCGPIPGKNKRCGTACAEGLYCGG